MKRIIPTPLLQRRAIDVALIGLVIIAVSMSLAQSFWPVVGVLGGLFVLIGMAAVFLARPAWGVWLTLGLLFFGNRAEIPALAFWGRYLPTLGVMIVILAVIARRILAGNWRWKGLLLIVCYMLFVLLLLLSAAYNATTGQDIVLSLLTNLRYPLFFIALINTRLGADFYHRVIKVFVALTLLQVPICAVQFSQGLKGDLLNGTLGINAGLVAVILVSQCALLARWLTTRKHGLRYLLAILALTVIDLLADVQVGLIFFLVMAGFITFRHYGLRRLTGVLSSGVILILLSLGLVVVAAASIPAVGVFLAVLPEHWALLLDFMNPNVTAFASVGRLTVIPLSFSFLLQEPVRLIWGFGPEATQGGLLTSGTIGSSSGGIVCQQLQAIGGLCRDPQSFRTLMEFGLLGTILYMLPLFLLWRYCTSLLRHIHSAESRFVLLLFEGVSCFYIVLGIWYVGVWRLDSYSFTFWLLAAAITAEGAVIKAARSATAPRAGDHSLVREPASDYA